MAKTVLITGVSGYIASHSAKYFLQHGYDVVGIDDFSLGNEGAIVQLSDVAEKQKQKFVFYKEDIASCDYVLKQHKIDVAIHFAAFSLVGESVLNPLKYYSGNVLKSTLLFQSLLNNGVKKLVFSSTAAVYGEPKQVPIKEDYERNPVNPYGRSKLIIEQVLDDLDKASGFKSIRLRYFNVAGADFEGYLGEKHNPETHLIPNVLKTALNLSKGEKSVQPFVMMGTDYPTKDGTCIRDYIHVLDIAAAHYLAAEKLLQGEETACYNLGSGCGYSVREVFETCKKITALPLPFVEVERREGDPSVLVASNEKAKRELGWSPEHTLEEMVYSAWQWAQNPKF